jgi:signal transduction histidine kinase
MLLFYQLMQRHKKERLLDTYAAETRLSRKVHDEIANEIYGALHYIENEEVISGAKKERLISQLDNIYLLTRNISRETNDIDVGLRYPGQLKLMIGSYADAGVNIIIKGLSKIEWDKVEPTKKIVVYRVLQELMVNMQKHSEATVVLIDFSPERKKVKIVYSDNGVGISGCPELKLNNGLQNVENRMVSIGGTVTFDTKAEKGFYLELNFTGS